MWLSENSFLSPYLLSLHSLTAGLSLLVSLSLFSYPLGPCINTFLFPHHLPLLPVFIWTDKSAVALWQDTLGCFLLREGEKVSGKWVTERGEVWYMQVQKFTAFMQLFDQLSTCLQPQGPPQFTRSALQWSAIHLYTWNIKAVRFATEILPLCTNNVKTTL